jgi:hypothetical protein
MKNKEKFKLNELKVDSFITHFLLDEKKIIGGKDITPCSNVVMCIMDETIGFCKW